MNIQLVVILLKNNDLYKASNCQLSGLREYIILYTFWDQMDNIKQICDTL